MKLITQYPVHLSVLLIGYWYLDSHVTRAAGKSAAGAPPDTSIHEDGIGSGCVVNDGGFPIVVYEKAYRETIDLLSGTEFKCLTLAAKYQNVRHLHI